MAVSEQVLNAVNLFSSTSVFDANKGSVGATDLNFIKQTTAELATEGGGIIAQSLGTNGYVKFANGLILQWGYNLGTTSTTDTFTFPIAFPIACHTIITSVKWDTNDGYSARPVTAFTKTNFTMYVKRSDFYICWISFGK